jgi:hypothetical protein
MEKAYVFNTRVSWWFLLLIPLVAFGFYPTYFAILQQPTPKLIHIHFALMAVWVIVLVVQPFLYRQKKLALHRRIGKFTYALVPAIVVTASLVIRNSYFKNISAFEHPVDPGATPLSHADALKQSASFEAIAVLYLGWICVFYLLAIANRKKPSTHARFMIAAALTMLGPTVDRIVYWIVQDGYIAGFLPIESISFILQFIILIFVLSSDHRNKRPTRTVAMSIAIYLGGQLLYFLFKDSGAWSGLLVLIMRPGG